MAGADAQWVLDIAANLPDGAATIAELDRLTERLTGAGQRSDGFQAALKRLSSELDLAKAASEKANQALAAGNDQYKILEREALRASKALERANQKNVVPIELAREAQRANAALKAYEATLRPFEAEAAKAAAAQSKLASSLDKVKKLGAHVDARNAALNQKYEKLGQVVGMLPGPLGRFGGAAIRGAKANHELGIAVGTSRAAMLVAGAGAAIAAAAIVALTAAMVAGTAAAFGYAASMADAHRDAGLAREAFAALSPETSAAASAFSAIAAETGATDAELVALTKSLRAAEVSAADMPKALRAAALAEAALGKGGAAEFISRLEDGELAVSSFASEVDAKFGGIVAARMRGIGQQSARLEKLWAKLFSGVNLDPVLDAMAILVGMFDKANPLAQAMALAIEKAFNFIAAHAVPAAQAVEAFALGFAIQAVKMYIALKPFLGGLDSLSFSLDTAQTMGKVFAVAAAGIAIALGAVAVVGAVILGTLAAIVAVIGAVVVGLFGLGVAIGYAVAWMISGIAYLVEAGYNLGRDLIMGLVNGIVAFVPQVITAISNAVTGAVDTAKELLGIHSPSRVFAEIGTQTVAGFTGAVEAGAPEAESSMATLVGPDNVSGATQTAAAEAPARAGGGKVIDFSGATFTFNGVANAEQARDRFAELLTSILEDDADSLAGATT